MYIFKLKSSIYNVSRMSVDETYSEMSTSVNSEASYDIDIVKHHDGNIHFKSQHFATTVY